MSLSNIFDPSRGQYWKQGQHGYTSSRDEAHQFTKGEADDICSKPNVDDFPVPVDSEWTYVKCYKDVPVGIWLVKIETSREERNPYQVMEVHPNVSIIGHHFAFDERRVIAYKPLGELL